jgi:hypothetical protein
MVLDNRSKLGITLAVAVLAGLASVWTAVLLLVIAAFLIAWGQAPLRTEEFAGRLPCGNYVLKALARIDTILSSPDLRRKDLVQEDVVQKDLANEE